MRHIDLIVCHRQEAGTTGAEVALVEPHSYHLAIFRDGRVEWALGPGGFDLGFELRGEHALKWNARSIAIGLHGCFTQYPEGERLPYPPHNLMPTQAQLDSLELVCRGLAWWCGGELALNGHTELPDATRFPGKRCPGEHLDMDMLRKRTGLKSLV